MIIKETLLWRRIIWDVLVSVKYTPDFSLYTNKERLIDNPNDDIEMIVWVQWNMLLK